MMVKNIEKIDIGVKVLVRIVGDLPGSDDEVLFRGVCTISDIRRHPDLGEVIYFDDCDLIAVPAEIRRVYVKKLKNLKYNNVKSKRKNAPSVADCLLL